MNCVDTGGAAHLGFKYPDTFGVVSITAGPLGSFAELRSSPSGRAAATLQFGQDEAYFQANQPATLVHAHAETIRGRAKIQLVYGQNDRHLKPPMVTFNSLLTSLGIAHVLTAVANHHTVLTAPDDRPFRFYQSAFNALHE